MKSEMFMNILRDHKLMAINFTFPENLLSLCDENVLMELHQPIPKPHIRLAHIVIWHKAFSLC
jgi:hypothetical protein